jgi:hypothetical protein
LSRGNSPLELPQKNRKPNAERYKVAMSLSEAAGNTARAAGSAVASPFSGMYEGVKSGVKWGAAIAGTLGAVAGAIAGGGAGHLFLAGFASPLVIGLGMTAGAIGGGLLLGIGAAVAGAWALGEIGALFGAAKGIAKAPSAAVREFQPDGPEMNARAQAKALARLRSENMDGINPDARTDNTQRYTQPPVQPPMPDMSQSRST